MLLRLLACFIAFVSTSALAAQETDWQTPVVMELYTSQGCSSCPPADKFASTFVNEEGHLVLSFHVHYWNYLGWKDPFSMPESTQRQRAYAAALGARNVYTPQMVVAGRYEVMGARRRDIRRAVKSASEDAGLMATKLVLNEDNTLGIETKEQSTALPATADIWLLPVSRHAETDVTAGENAGQTIINSNIVRGIFAAGNWQQGKANYTLPLPPDDLAAWDGYAVLIQEKNSGMILSGGVIWLK